MKYDLKGIRQMKKFALILTGLMVIAMLLTACNAATPVINIIEASNTESTAPESSAPAETEAAVSSEPVQTEPAETDEPVETEQAATSSPEAPAILQETKDYLLHGQEDKSEAEKLHWTQAFLDQVDIQAVYDEYIAAGGKADDVLSFAQYLTENAPVPGNWKELFEADLLAQYEVTPSRYEALDDGYYQVYVIMEGAEVPYVGLNARTGYFHG